jgi:diacylglycerol kinase (ATP)
MRSKDELDEAIKTRRRAALVVNAHSRSGREQYETARERLTAAGFDIAAAYPVDPPGELEADLRAATDLGIDLLVCGGGDGTTSAAARHLAHRDVALGLLPLGTTNNFARTLGLPLDLDAAIDTLTRGKVVDVDLGLAGDKVFANHVGIGLSADIMAKAPSRLKRAAGRLAYPMTALALLLRHRPMPVTVTTGGRTLTVETHQLYVANGGFHAGRPIAADADADDRRLIVYAVGGTKRLSLLGETVRNASTGHRRRVGDTDWLAVTELTLETDRPARLDVDGELGGTTPVRIRLDANALRVMAPPDTTDR